MKRLHKSQNIGRAGGNEIQSMAAIGLEKKIIKKFISHLTRRFDLFDFVSAFGPFWAADPKGTMSYRTKGGISVRP